MSRAFMKESEGEWLGDVAPDVPALERYLTKDNDGRKVFEVKSEKNADGKDLHHMSNGNCYMLDEDNRWKLVI